MRAETGAGRCGRFFKLAPAAALSAADGLGLRPTGGGFFFFFAESSARLPLLGDPPLSFLPEPDLDPFPDEPGRAWSPLPPLPAVEGRPSPSPPAFFFLVPGATALSRRGLGGGIRCDWAQPS